MFGLTLGVRLRRWAVLMPLAVLGGAVLPPTLAIAPPLEPPIPSKAVAQVKTDDIKIGGIKTDDTAAVVGLLQALPKPAGAPTSAPVIHSPNSYGQKALNFQIAATDSEKILAFYRDRLTEEKYTERTINTVSGAWGFSVVFVPPADFALKPQSSTSEPALQVGDSLTVHSGNSPQVMLVIQATVLSPERVNINMRYEEL